MRVHRDVPHVMPYLHLPIQSGSNLILKDMNRKHTREQYLDLIEKIRSFRPDIALSSDFIVGFPGETDQDFEDTLDLIQKIRFSQTYFFKYAPRGEPQGTPRKKKVQKPLKAKGLARLQNLLNQQQQAFNEACLGKVLPVLFDRMGKKEDQYLGKTPYLQSVYITSNTPLLGKCTDVLIEKAYAKSLTGPLQSDQQN